MRFYGDDLLKLNILSCEPTCRLRAIHFAGKHKRFLTKKKNQRLCSTFPELSVIDQAEVHRVDKLIPSRVEKILHHTCKRLISPILSKADHFTCPLFNGVIHNFSKWAPKRYLVPCVEFKQLFFLKLESLQLTQKRLSAYFGVSRIVFSRFQPISKQKGLVCGENRFQVQQNASENRCKLPANPPKILNY